MWKSHKRWVSLRVLSLPLCHIWLTDWIAQILSLVSYVPFRLDLLSWYSIKWVNAWSRATAPHLQFVQGSLLESTPCFCRSLAIKAYKEWKVLQNFGGFGTWLEGKPSMSPHRHCVCRDLDKNPSLSSLEKQRVEHP